MKVTKNNGKVVLFDEEKVVSSILKANRETSGEKISEKKAHVLADEIFTRLTDRVEIITTQDVRACTAEILREKGFPRTEEKYLTYKK